MLDAIRKISVAYLFIFAVAVALANLWIFARFTVDDAFISWRYGKNLIEAGIWAYNPTAFDLTQAYTNPIYAFASVIPAAAGIDPVLFFKIVSIVLLVTTAAVFAASISKARVSLSLLAIFLIAPKTLLHVFSGLETFLYIALTGFLFIALDKRAFGAATWLTCVLSVTRPEAWLIACLVPAFVFLTAQRDRIAQTLRTGIPIFLLLCFYFGTHYWHFGGLLPNTFYAKSFTEFSDIDTIKLILSLSPLLALALLPGKATFVLVVVYSVTLVIKYTTSTLAMNYGDRFVFHIFGPLYLYAVYKLDRHVISANPSDSSPSRQRSAQRRRHALTAWLFICAFTAGFYYDTFSYIRFINYTPRLLSVHGEFGHVLRELSEQDRIDAFAMGDAGLAPFHSSIPVLDLLGLGSRSVTKGGITQGLIRQYEPDVIVIYANRERVLDRPTWHDALLEYAKYENFLGSCRLHVDNYERLVVHSRVPHPEIEALCAKTEARNNVVPSVFLRRHIAQPPWHFWHD